MRIYKLAYIFMFAGTVAIAIDFVLAMLYTGGRIDINALYNQYGLSFGEGWIEAGIFVCFSVLGALGLVEKNENMTK